MKTKLYLIIALVTIASMLGGGVPAITVAASGRTAYVELLVI